MSGASGSLPQRSADLAVATALMAVALAVVVDAALIPLGRDSAVFMLIGQGILHGSIPYLDLWDHKPPAIFYINAVGLSILGQTGVRMMEFVALTAASLLSFRAMSPTLGRPFALFATVYWLVSAPLVLDGGNLTEEFGLVVQFAALFVLFGWPPTRHWTARWVTLGCLTALAILLKPTLVGVFLVGVPFLLVTIAATKTTTPISRTICRAIFAYVIGLVLVSAPVIAYFWSRSALAAMVDEVVVYNFWYSHFVNWSARLDSAWRGLVVLSRSGLAPIGIVSAITGTILVLVVRSCSLEVRRIVTFSAVWLVAEIALSSTSGRLYAHYYIAWLPPLALSAGGLAALLGKAGTSKRRTFARLLPIAVLVGGSLVPAARMLRDAATLPDAAAVSRASAARYVSSQTRSGDTVLLWGAEAIVNLQSGRESPTRFVYLYPLFTRGYQTRELTDAFLSGLKSSPPALIVDASAEVPDYISPLDRGARAAWQPQDPTYAKPPGLESVLAFIDSNYRLEDLVGPRQWPVYRYAPP